MKKQNKTKTKANKNKQTNKQNKNTPKYVRGNTNKNRL